MKDIYDFPFRKDYKLNIELDIDLKVQKKISIDILYKQATIHETIKEMDRIDKDGLHEWFVSFLKKNSKITDNELSLLSMTGESFKEILHKILTTRHSGVVDEDSLNKDKTEDELEEKPIMPFSAILVMISEKIHLDPVEFQNKYTFEQMKYIISGMEYISNESTEEGQLKNKEKYGKDYNYDAMLIEKLSKI